MQAEFNESQQNCVWIGQIFSSKLTGSSLFLHLHLMEWEKKVRKAQTSRCLLPVAFYDGCPKDWPTLAQFCFFIKYFSLKICCCCLVHMVSWGLVYCIFKCFITAKLCYIAKRSMVYSIWYENIFFNINIFVS